MSDHDHHHDQHGHDGHHGHHGHDEHAEHGDLKSYTIGFILSVILTAIPFYLVMTKAFDKSSTTAAVILAFAFVQVVVHMIYFLHMNGKVEGGWSLSAMLFTVVLLVITMSGSIWVLYHLNHNMMPGMMEQATDMRNMP